MNQKCLGPRVDTPKRKTKDNFCLCNFIIRLRFWLQLFFVCYRFFWLPLYFSCWCWNCMCMSRLVATQQYALARIYSTYWSNGLCWWSRMSQNEKGTSKVWCFFPSQTMFLSQAIVSDFRFPFISFHHQNQSTKKKNARAERQQIHKFIFRFFFVCVLALFACLTIFFYLLPCPIFLFFLVGWLGSQIFFIYVNFLHVYFVNLFFPASTKWLLFHMVHFLCVNTFACVVLSFENPFEHSFLSYCNGIFYWL